MFPLYDVRMTASAMEGDASAVLSKMRLVIKDYVPLDNVNFGFDKPLFMTTCLQAIGIGDIRHRSRIIGPDYVAQLS